MTAIGASAAETRDVPDGQAGADTPDMEIIRTREIGELVDRMLIGGGVELGTVAGAPDEIAVLTALVRYTQLRLSQCHERLRPEPI